MSGTSINRSRVFEEWGLSVLATPFGDVEYANSGNLVVLNRHGFSNPKPPHASNFKGNAWALKELGVDEVVALSSVGSLHCEIRPGSFVSCSDYASFDPITFNDDSPSGFMPEIANRLVSEIEKELAYPINKEKVYAQTRGPRFETKAEVRILANWGCHVVGMTFAHEADLILELELPLNSVCMVDNLAHGIANAELSMERFHQTVRENQSKVDSLLSIIVERFA